MGNQKTAVRVCSHAIAEKREASGVAALNIFGVQTFYHWGNMF